MAAKKRCAFFITEELDRALKQLKERDGIAASEAIRRALIAYLTEKGVLNPSQKSAPRRASTRRKA